MPALGALPVAGAPRRHRRQLPRHEGEYPGRPWSPTHPLCWRTLPILQSLPGASIVIASQASFKGIARMLYSSTLECWRHCRRRWWPPAP